MFKNSQKVKLLSIASTNPSKLRFLLSALILFTISVITISCGNSTDSVTKVSSNTPSATPTESTFIKNIEQDSVDYLTKAGVKNITVSCPQNITAADVGKTFDCQVSSEQGKFRSEVIYKSPQDIKFKSKGLVVLSKIESQIQKLIKEKNNIEATINCDSAKVGISVYQKVGDTLECSVSAPSGEKGTAIVTFMDEYGNVIDMNVKNN